MLSKKILKQNSSSYE